MQLDDLGQAKPNRRMRYPRSVREAAATLLLIAACDSASVTNSRCIQGDTDPSPHMLATNESPQVLAADGESIYWTRADGTLVRLSRCGGQPTIVATLSGVSPASAILVDDQNIFWETLGAMSAMSTIFRVSKGGGTPVPLVDSAASAGRLAMNTTDLYLFVAASPGAIGRVSKQGGTVQMVAPAMYANALAATDDRVCWGSDYKLWCLMLPNGQPTVFVDQGSMVQIPSAAIGDGEVCFDGLYGLYCVAVTGGMPTQVSPTISEAPPLIDGGRVYFLDNGLHPTTQAVKTSPFAGGVLPTIVVERMAAIYGFVVDDGYVYWSGADGIGRVAKP